MSEKCVCVCVRECDIYSDELLVYALLSLIVCFFVVNILNRHTSLHGARMRACCLATVYTHPVVATL